MAGSTDTKRPVRRTAPPIADWAREEMATVQLGDQRLNKRAASLLSTLGKRPNLSIPAACKGRAELKAAYGFCNNDRTSFDNILQPHCQRTRQRMVEHKGPPQEQLPGKRSRATMPTQSRGHGTHALAGVRCVGRTMAGSGALPTAYKEHAPGSAIRGWVRAQGDREQLGTATLGDPGYSPTRLTPSPPSAQPPGVPSTRSRGLAAALQAPQLPLVVLLFILLEPLGHVGLAVLQQRVHQPRQFVRRGRHRLGPPRPRRDPPEE